MYRDRHYKRDECTGTYITGERNVQGQTLQVRYMYRERHYKGEECTGTDITIGSNVKGHTSHHYNWEDCTGDGQYM